MSSTLGSRLRTGTTVHPVPRMREEPGVRWGIANTLLLFALTVLIGTGAGVVISDTVLVVVVVAAHWSGAQHAPLD
jgi:hypothetical protein